MKRLLRDLAPPAVWRGLSRLRHRAGGAGGGAFARGVEQPPEYYDHAFHKSDDWKLHYTRSRYYPLWTVVADRVRRAGARRVVDIGCGPGQVACLLRDTGVPQYTGLDFSPARVQQARTVCPEFEFVAVDVFASDLLESAEYDMVLTMEFLEHVDRDLDVLRRIRPGTPVLATVPNFPGTAHVRHFTTAAEVAERYGQVLSDVDVYTILADPQGKTYFLLHGTR